ncbi:MAG TPA: cell wall hydrolase [Caulobacteraceae bacterium]|nr:cell wall hydrolase [Caulobacteraceae bacterium]
MFNVSTTRENARALLGAALTGSAVGLILAAAYLGGSLAQAGPNAAAPAADQLLPTAQVQAAPVAVPAAIRAQGDRSGELLKASLAGPAARPFRSEARSDVDCLTQAIYYEARGEGPAGQAAVAQVVLNRVRHPSFPKSVCAVVYQGCQFSFACDGSTRRGRETRAWSRAQRIATKALSGAVVANVGNATHFHTVNVSPNWGPSLVRVGQVGLHIFYRFGGRNGRPGMFTAEAETTQAPEPGLYEYARLDPSERVYLTSSAVAPKVELKPVAGTIEVATAQPVPALAQTPTAKPAVAVEVKPAAPVTAPAAPSSAAVS